MSYTKVPLSEFFVRSHGLLFNQGVSDIEIKMAQWDDVPCFLSRIKIEYSHVMFCCSFFLITRYEEYLPHVKDHYERFNAEQSIIYKFQFLEKPIVNIWAKNMSVVLLKSFQILSFLKGHLNMFSTLDIDNAFAYKYKVYSFDRRSLSMIFSFESEGFLGSPYCIVRNSKGSL